MSSEDKKKIYDLKRKAKHDYVSMREASVNVADLRQQVASKQSSSSKTVKQHSLNSCSRRHGKALTKPKVCFEEDRNKEVVSTNDASTKEYQCIHTSMASVDDGLCVKSK